MTNPFKTFRVLPFYGASHTVVEWELADDAEGAVYLYYSEAGVPGSWTILNPNLPETGRSGQYLVTLPFQDPFRFIYFRGLVDAGGPPETWLKGPAVTALDTLPRSEYFVVREIMRREYHSMKFAGNGLRAFHLIPREKGAAASNTDAETRQRLGPDCPASGLDGYGHLYAGGFYPPVQTWVRLTDAWQEDHKPRQDATGEDIESDHQFRLLAFPRPDEHHVIALIGTDQRFVLSQPMQPFYFRGMVPICWHVSVKLLERDDPRCRIPLPEPLPG